MMMAQAPRASAFAAGGAAFMAGASYGVVTPLAKLAQGQGLTAGQLALFQYAVPLVVLWTASWLKGKPPTLGGSSWWPPVLAGISAGMTSWLYYGALAHLSAGLAVLLLFQFAWMVVVVEAIAKRRWPQPRILWSVGLVWVGTVASVGFGLGLDLRASVVGWALGIGAGAAYAVSLYANGQMDPRLPTAWRAATAASLACLTVLTTAWLAGGQTVRWRTEPQAWWWLVAVGCFSQALPVWLLAWSAPRIGGTLAAILASSELPVALVGSWIALGQRFGWLTWVGVAIILSGIGLGQSAEAESLALQPSTPQGASRGRKR